MEAILSYDSDTSENSDKSDGGHYTATDLFAHLKPVDDTNSVSKTIALNSTPVAIPLEDVSGIKHIDPKTKEVKYNPKYDELYAPQVGPTNPYKTRQATAIRNSLAGYVEDAHVSRYAIDPTVDSETTSGTKMLGDSIALEENKGLTAFEKAKKRPEDKRKRHLNDDPSNIEGFIGPWGKFVDEQTVMKPNEEEKAELDEILAKRAKTVKDAYDYQGRSYLHVPQDVGVNLKSEYPPEKCFIPKKLIHTWAGHTKGVAQIRWFPKSAHLLLSASMDSKIKIWEVYNDRRCVRTYLGHKQAVRDINFNNSGTEFLSCAYDRYCKLWDTETGECKARFTSRKVAYCVKFHPEEDKQHLFVAGTSDKKIVCWDTRSGEIVQEYDRHLGAVNTITFVDQNRRFVSTSDDKSLRVWEWDIPVDFNYLISGDADGKLYIWDWKTTKLYSKFKAHDDVCIAAIWHPHETSKVATAGWDGVIKYWD
ncbi:PRP17-like protein [Mya arenaria]|uniref:PRP17-like protein n=1 Tax=Mya arenaria TaxID=6604 RepID=A0ABY7ECV6_MYAAR|nr:PRP17-like protein [Mya arenaria]